VLLLRAGAPLAHAETQSNTPPAGAKHAVVDVKGMACPFCAFGLKKHLQRLPGVKNVEVSLEKGQAVLDVSPGAKLTDDQIRKAIRDSGFNPGEIKWHSPGQEPHTKEEKP
jgi:copper chaperone CopZ